MQRDPHMYMLEVYPRECGGSTRGRDRDGPADGGPPAEQLCGFPDVLASSLFLQSLLGAGRVAVLWVYPSSFLCGRSLPFGCSPVGALAAVVGWVRGNSLGGLGCVDAAVVARLAGSLGTARLGVRFC